MKLTILGAHASYVGPGNASSGYLVQSEKTHVLVDCGSGTLSNLGRVIDPHTLDAIVVTHAHPDHFVDLYGIESMLRYAPDGPLPPVALLCPDGLVDAMEDLLPARARGEWRAAFVPAEHHAGRTAVVGDIEIVALPVEHSVPTFGLRISDGSVTVAFSSDTRFGEPLLAVLRDSDLAVVEATLPEAYAGRSAHLTAREAGLAAREAGARELVLTHLWPTNDPDAFASDATDAFGKLARAGRPLDTYHVTREGVTYEPAQ